MSTASDLFGDAVDQTELRRNLDHLALLLDHDHWLPLVSNLQLVSDVEVFGHTDTFVIFQIEK